MKLKNGLYLGKIGTNFFVWNTEKLISLYSKNLEGAIKEGEKL